MIDPFYTINVEVKGHYGASLDKISKDLKMNFTYEEGNNGPSITYCFKCSFLEEMKLRYKQKRP